MSSSSQLHNVIKNTEEQTDVWELPHVEKKDKVEDEKTNALGFKTDWKYEPPEEQEIDEPVPLTAEEIEEIRQAAFEEGFNQGKEEGFAKGYEEGKPKGHEEGLKLGHAEGIDQGIQEGEKIIADHAKRFESLIQQMHNPLKLVDKNTEEQLLQLVASLTEAVTLEEAKINPDILLSAITEGIKALPSQEAQTQILLNPEDIKLVEEKFGDEYIKEQGWRLLAAPQFENGSCQIENSISNIDLRMKTRLKEVLDLFLQDALHQPEFSETDLPEIEEEEAKQIDIEQTESSESDPNTTTDNE